MISNVIEFISNYWPIGLILVAIAMYKYLFRLFGIVIVPEDKIGLITKVFTLIGQFKNLSGNRIIATRGESGFQAKVLAPGVHFWYWPWQYQIKMENLIVIPEGHIGLINAKDGDIPKTGRMLGRKKNKDGQEVKCDNFQDAEAFINNGGQKGRQSSFITTGTYKINTHLFEVSTVKQVHIEENMVGIITTQDGEPLEMGQIAGREVPNEVHNNFQNFDDFLESGGNRGIQQQVLQAGSYNLNPWAVKVEEHHMTEIPIGNVGVVMSYYGTEGVDITGSDFKHGNLVSKGQKGVWADPLNPGKYAINTYTCKVEVVPTTNLVLNWASARSESHNLDKNLSTITVRSKDGFQFNLDVSQIIHIPINDAPKVIARFGNMNNLVSQVLEPTIGNYFRNSAQDSDAISFLISRQQRQNSAKDHISKVLEEYNVHAVDTLIGDIVPPPDLMKTLTDRKIAEQLEITYETQRKTQEKRQILEKETAIADMQKEVVKAEQGVQIAEKIADAVVRKQKGDSEAVEIAAKADSNSIEMRAKAESTRISLTGDAEAGRILAKGKADAESYNLAVEAMGKENFTSMKIMAEIGQNGVKLIPDFLITGGSGGTSNTLEGMLGLSLMEKLGKTVNVGSGEDVSTTTKDETPSKDTRKKK